MAATKNFVMRMRNPDLDLQSLECRAECQPGVILSRSPFSEIGGLPRDSRLSV
jgi:hypothetical protein